MTTTPIAAGPLDVTVRAQFERWYSNDGKWSSALERSGDGYKYQGADHAWHVWQAAVSQEREACAKLVSDIGDDWEHIGDMQKVSACDYLEDAIRMRSNVKWTAYAPPILSLRRPFWIERWDQGIAGIEQILVSDASSPG